MIKKVIFIFAAAVISFNLFAQPDNELEKINSGNIVLGVVDTLSSEILQEKRIINIYLPEDYSAGSPATYPVIYLLDGGVEEDFIHITGIVKYYTTPWIDRFPKSIVVGIGNVNRRRDFTFATANLDFVAKMGFDKKDFLYHGGSEKFILFIENELQPFLQKHYKTNSSRTLIGESLGGLLATEILLKKPSLFDTYIIVSPSLWWGNESLLAMPIAPWEKNFSNNLEIYIAAANKKEDIIMYNDAQSLALKLKSDKSTNINVSFDYIDDETHATILHQAVYNAFKKLYPKKVKTL